MRSLGQFLPEKLGIFPAKPDFEHVTEVTQPLFLGKSHDPQELEITFSMLFRVKRALARRFLTKIALRRRIFT